MYIVIGLLRTETKKFFYFSYSEMYWPPMNREHKMVEDIYYPVPYKTNAQELHSVLGQYLPFELTLCIQEFKSEAEQKEEEEYRDSKLRAFSNFGVVMNQLDRDVFLTCAGINYGVTQPYKPVFKKIGFTTAMSARGSTILPYIHEFPSNEASIMLNYPRVREAAFEYALESMEHFQGEELELPLPTYTLEELSSLSGEKPLYYRRRWARQFFEYCSYFVSVMAKRCIETYMDTELEKVGY